MSAAVDVAGSFCSFDVYWVSSLSLWGGGRRREDGDASATNRLGEQVTEPSSSSSSCALDFETNLNIKSVSLTWH